MNIISIQDRGLGTSGSPEVVARCNQEPTAAEYREMKARGITGYECPSNGCSTHAPDGWDERTGRPTRAEPTPGWGWTIAGVLLFLINIAGIIWCAYALFEPIYTAAGW